MGRRKAHHRRECIRTNADGSKSYVRSSYVREHNYRRKNEPVYYSSGSGNSLENFLVIYWFAWVVVFLLEFIGRTTAEDIIWMIVLFFIGVTLTIAAKRR